MNLANYLNYGMCIYNNSFTNKCEYKLGDVVINQHNEIGVLIQIHSDEEFRTDMFGNCCDDEIRLATNEEILKYRPNVATDGSFKH